jgi:hypothetical protein
MHAEVTAIGVPIARGLAGMTLIEIVARVSRPCFDALATKRVVL